MSQKRIIDYQRNKKIEVKINNLKKDISNNIKHIDYTGNHLIIIGDCIDYLDYIKDESCQLVFADPPYNIGKKFGDLKYKWDTPDEYRGWCINWIEKCIKKLTPDGSVMIMGHPRFSSYIVPYLDKNLFYTNQIIYYYTDGMPEKKNFERRYEMILYYRKSEDKYIFNIDDVRVPLVRYDKHSNLNGKNPNDVWQINRVRWNSKERVSLPNNKIAHVAQKPIRLLRRILLAVTNKGDVILDPFLGTGTTSVAAKELGRKSIGIEIYPDYAKIAMERIESTKIIYKPLDYDER